MRVINRNDVNEYVVSETAETNSELEQTAGPATHKSYHEMADFPVVENDGLAQLHANLALLEDLRGRLSFVMKEIRYLLKA